MQEFSEIPSMTEKIVQANNGEDFLHGRRLKEILAECNEWLGEDFLDARRLN